MPGAASAGHVEPIDQRLDVGIGELVGKRQHLRRRAAFLDRLDRLGPAQARETFREQRRAGDTEAPSGPWQAAQCS